jgi:hypothetical protein
MHWNKRLCSKPLTVTAAPPSRVSEHLFGFRVEAYLGELALAMSKIGDN